MSHRQLPPYWEGDKKCKKPSWFLPLFCFFGVHTSQVAYAQNVGTKFNAISVACGTFSGPPDAVTNRVVVNMSEDPRMNGTGQVSVFIEGQQVFIEAIFHSSEFDGSWIAPGHSATTNDPVIHHGYGTGDFEGQKIKFKAIPQPDFLLENPPCENLVGWLDPDWAGLSPAGFQSRVSRWHICLLFQRARLDLAHQQGTVSSHSLGGSTL